MPVLDEQVLLECKSDVFNINEDYNLNGKLVTVPKGQTFKFAGGSLNNGIIRFDDTFLEDVAPRSIDLQTEGTITNEVVKMSWFADVNQVRIAFSNQVIEYDQDETINTTVVIPGNNLTYDGMGNTFTCNETFFSNQGKSNIIIRNFNANANTNKFNLTFYEMPSIENVSIDNIQIYNNVITGFMIGISLNNDTENGPGASNIYLLGPNMSLVQYPSYVIKWLANTLNNQIIGGITRYSLYKNTAGSGFINYD